MIIARDRDEAPAVRAALDQMVKKVVAAVEAGIPVVIEDEPLVDMGKDRGVLFVKAIGHVWTVKSLRVE